MKSLKAVLKFWQEIVFIIMLGMWIGGITMNTSVYFQHTISIFFYCMFILLLVCLVGQFYWKNFALGLCLAIISGLGSAYMILAALSDIAKMDHTDRGYHETLLLAFLFIGLTITAILMPYKYYKSIQ